MVKNTGNISRGGCESGKQTSAQARVCLQDLQVPREILPVFLTNGRLIYILHLQKCPILPFMTSQSDVNDTLTLHHLFCFWRNLVYLNVRKDLSSLRKLSLLSSSKITKNSIKIAMKINVINISINLAQTDGDNSIVFTLMADPFASYYANEYDLLIT